MNEWKHESQLYYVKFIYITLYYYTILYYIVGPPPLPLLKGRVGPSENWVTRGGGVWNFLLERGDKPEKGGGERLM